MADSYNSSEASHRALRTIQQALERHPIVTAVQGFPDGNFTEIRADLAVERWGIERGSAALTVHWFAGETPDACPEFEFHYSDGETTLDGITTSKGMSTGGGIFRNELVTPDTHTNHIRSKLETQRNSLGKSCRCFLPNCLLSNV